MESIDTWLSLSLLEHSRTFFFTFAFLSISTFFFTSQFRVNHLHLLSTTNLLSFYLSSSLLTLLLVLLFFSSLLSTLFIFTLLLFFLSSSFLLSLFLLLSIHFRSFLRYQIHLRLISTPSSSIYPSIPPLFPHPSTLVPLSIPPSHTLTRIHRPPSNINS